MMSVLNSAAFASLNLQLQNLTQSFCLWLSAFLMMEVEYIDMTNKISRDEEELLLNGYLNDKNQKQVPRDIVSLLLLFCGNLYHQWVFYEYELNQWLFMRPGECLVNDKIINIDDLKLQCIIYPNGIDYYTKGYVQFYLKIKRFSPVTIKSITMYYELYCIELGKRWKNTACFNKKDEVKWGEISMKLLECENRDKLTFGCFIDVIDIIYNPYNVVSNKNKKLWVKDVKIHEKCRFKWKIKSEWISPPTTEKDEASYFSDNFNNDTFCLYYTNFMRNYDKYTVGIKLLSLPYNIKRIDIDYNFLYNGGYVWNEYQSQSFSIKNKGRTVGYQNRTDRTCGKSYRSQNDDVHPKDEEIVVEIIIKAIYSQLYPYIIDDAKVLRSQWKQYGIIMEQDNIKC